ncbi:hypothetical protein K439DRAFT_1244353, partial [Ramaria rubella]
LGELVWLDSKKLQSYRVVPMRHTVRWFSSAYGYFLPGHKADLFFEGNHLILQKVNSPIDPYDCFVSYLRSQDRKFPRRPELWLRLDGSIPTRSWFLAHFRQHFPPDVTGQSIHTGGATALA